MSKNEDSKSIIWSLDPFLKNKATNENAAAWLKTLNLLQDPSSLQAVYVVNPDQISLPIPDFPGYIEDWISDYFPHASKKLQAEMKRVIATETIPSQVIVNTECSLTAVAESLTKYAADHRSDIVLTKSTRTKLSKFFLGSFTETLLDVSENVNVIILPNLKPPKRKGIRKFLMPTLFTSTSSQALEEIIEYCRRFDAELVFFYQEAPSRIFRSFRVPSNIELASRDHLKEAADNFVAMSLKSGVQAKVYHVKSDEPVSEAIVKASQKENCDAILMVPERAGISKHLGSVVKQTLRLSQLPVFILSQSSE